MQEDSVVEPCTVEKVPGLQSVQTVAPMLAMDSEEYLPDEH